MTPEDRDRIIRMEIGIDAIIKSIEGEHGVIKRMNWHGQRISRLEKTVLIGTGIFLTVSTGIAMAKDVLVEWMKKKIETSN